MDGLPDIESGAIAAAFLPREALDLLPEAVALFDAADRLILWNSRYAACYPSGVTLDRGMTFRDILECALRDGHIVEARGREPAWIEERMRQHQACDGVHEHQLADGRWISVQERRSPQGWIVGIRTDITALKQREASFRLLFNANPTPMFVFRRNDLRLTAANEAALALYGYTREQFLAMTMLDLRPESDRAEYLGRVANGTAFNYAGDRTRTHLRADGREMHVLPHARALTLEGSPVCLVSVLDHTERHAAMEELTQVRAFLDSVVEAIPIGVFAKDMRHGGRYVLYNRAGEALIGRDRSTILGRPDADVFGAEEAARFVAQDALVVRERQLRVFDQETLKRGDGEMRTIVTKKMPVATERDGEVRYIVGISEDITEQRRLASRLEHLAHHDALTGLPNRTLLHADLAEAGGSRGCALHYIDLDGFKAVNDRLGHKIGDALLCAVSERLRGTIRPHDLAVRLGGDEFVVIQRDGAERALAEACARHLVEALGAPYQIEGHSIVIGASVGIALADDGPCEADILLRNADVALYAAKTAGRGGWRVFSPDVAIASLLHSLVADEIRRALANHDIALRYRPVVDLRSGSVTGFEALPHWQHPERGVLEADQVAALAAAAGLGGDLAAFVVGRACRDAALWPAALRLSLDLAPDQVRHEGLAGAVAQSLAQACLDAGRLVLNIAESALREDDPPARAGLLSLKARGVTLVLDRLGGAEAALRSAACFPFDGFRTEAALLRSAPEDRTSLAILKAIVALGTALDALVTATGVDTETQSACAVAAGCHAAQGLLWSDTPASPGTVRTYDSPRGTTHAA